MRGWSGLRRGLYRGLCCALIAWPGLVAAADVRVEGVRGELQKSLLAGLSIHLLKEDASARLVRRRHASAEKELDAGLRAFGHYAAQIESTLTFADDGSWQARYQITPGPRLRWAEPDIRLEPAAQPDWLRPLQGLARVRTGMPVDHRHYEDLKTALRRTAESQGHLDATFGTHRLEVDPQAGRARMILVLQPGPAYRFGQVQIQQDILNPAFLQRFNPIQSGDRFDTNRVLDLRLRLFDLDYFRNIEVDSRQDAETATIDLDLLAEPKPPQRWQVGLGYGTDTGPRVTGSFEQRYLNRDGHKVRGDARVSEVKLDLSARYAIPTGPEPGAEWGFRTQRIEERLGDADVVTLRTGLSRSRIRGPRLWNYYLDYEGERVDLAGSVRKTDLILPGLSLTLRRHDDLLLPRDGYTIFVDLHGASDELGSSATFFQSRVDARLIRPLSSRSRLILRAQAGANFLDDTEELPTSQRFFAGGDSSIRGYSYRRVAPRNAAGEIVGGRYLQTFTLELDRLLWRDYGAAVFYDVGSASDRWLSDLVAAVGLGFRWATPVGMLRVDVAHPLDDPNSQFQLHIGIGGEL